MRLRVVSVAVAVTLVAGASLLAQSFSLRTGSWALTISGLGGMPMDGLPPEARAQLEAALSKPQTYNTCITAEDLKNFNLGRKGDDDDEDCKIVTSNVTATVAEVTRQCSGDEPRTETARFEAATPQTLKGTITSKSASGATTMTLAGKWVAAKCVE